MKCEEDRMIVMSSPTAMIVNTLLQYPMELGGYCVVTVGSDESSPIQHTFVFNTLRQSQGFINSVKGIANCAFHSHSFNRR